MTRSGGVGELRRDRADPLEQDVLGLLAVGLPRRRVRPPGRGHLEVAHLDHAALRQLDPLGRRQDVVDLELVVVAGAHEHALGLAGQLLLGHLHPPLDGAQHVAVEEVVEPVGVGLELGQLVGRRAERVVAAPDHVLLERRHLVLAVKLAALLLQRAVPALAALVDDRDERLAGHVASQDHDVGLVVRAGVQELAPARLRPVNVGGEKYPHDRGFLARGQDGSQALAAVRIAAPSIVGACPGTLASTSCSSRCRSARRRCATASTRCRTAPASASRSRGRRRPTGRSRPRAAGRPSAPSTAPSRPTPTRRPSSRPGCGTTTTCATSG